MGPIFPDEGPRRARAVRLVRGVGAELVVFVLLTLTSPLVIPTAALVDGALLVVRRKRPTALRMLAFLWLFLARDLVAIVRLALLAPRRNSPAKQRAVYDLRCWWCGGHLDTVRRLFGLTFEIDDLHLVAPGPVVLLMRHASIIDNTLPDAIVGREHGLGLRFVLKQELQMLPVFDVGSRWVPTALVKRASGDTAAETAKLTALVTDLQPDEGLMIYPEGTRWTAPKLARAQEIVRERQPQVAPYADRLRYLLPPRLGGPLTLLEAARGTDVVFCGHVGLDGFELLSDIWAGGLVGQTVRIRFWRFPASDVPEDRDAMAAWLYERWLEVDAWIAAQREELGITTTG